MNLFKTFPLCGAVKLFLICNLCQNSLHADLSNEISEDLKVIFKKRESIVDKPESIEVFPDQGGSFINQIYLVTTSKKINLFQKLKSLIGLEKK
ncbi:MAG: hypothetical protein EB053_01315 [Chlamydiae bacterium]|nr:hypothetical protein [Chlamydiota bacterium]